MKNAVMFVKLTVPAMVSLTITLGSSAIYLEPNITEFLEIGHLPNGQRLSASRIWELYNYLTLP